MRPAFDARFSSFSFNSLIYKTLIFKSCNVFFDETPLVYDSGCSSGVVPYPAGCVYIGKVYVYVGQLFALIRLAFEVAFQCSEMYLAGYAPEYEFRAIAGVLACVEAA